jgi:hypothetical protein
LTVAGVAAATPNAVAAGSAGHPIRPGVSVRIADQTCTAGPLLHQRKTVYIAVPASCGGTGPGVTQNGCVEANAPLNIPVKVQGARHRALLVYDSFARMQSIGTSSSRVCQDNDLALVRINPRDLGRVTAGINGGRAPSGVRAHPPASGRSMTLGSHPATVGAAHQGGWEYDVTTTASLSSSDVGSAGVVGGRVLGMLTVLPSNMVSQLPIVGVMAPAEVYSLAKALQFLRKAPGFHHVTLLKAGERI